MKNDALDKKHRQHEQPCRQNYFMPDFNNVSASFHCEGVFLKRQLPHGYLSVTEDINLMPENP